MREVSDVDVRTLVRIMVRTKVRIMETTMRLKMVECLNSSLLIKSGKLLYTEHMLHEFSVPIKISYKNLMAAKFRSFLTVLGIIIGIASVIIVMAIGASAQKLILGQVEGIGSNLVGILPGAADEDGPPASVYGVIITTLKDSDIAAIMQKKNVPNAAAACGYVTGVGTAEYGSNSFQSNFHGVSASFLDVESNKLESGRFFTEEENIGLAKVAVLGSKRAEDLFPNEDPLGKLFSLKDVNFTVVGVFESKGNAGLSNVDEMIYIPVHTGQKIMLGINYFNFARVKIDSFDNVERAVEDIKYTLRMKHRIDDPSDDDFSVRSTAQAIETITKVTNILKYFLVGIAAISLLVGGIGIMNIMLISVNQRVKEVGLRKALGARMEHVVAQFLIESIFITVIGGFFGIVFGILFSFLASVVINSLGYSWEFIISLGSILLATSISVLIGIIFGLYPARKASKISPIEALSYE